MAIEKEKVISKLKEGGIDEKFGNGVSFETEEELNKWVGDVKTLLVKPKSIEEYTADELEALLKDPQPKARGLQALLDKERDKSKKKVVKKKNDDDKDNDDDEDEVKSKPEWKEFIEKMNKRMEDEDKEKETNKKTKSFNSIFDASTKGFEEEDKEYIKATLNLDSTEDDIKNAVSKYTAMMTKRGFKDFGISGDGDKNKGDLSKDKGFSDSIKRLLEKKEKENK